MLEMVSINDSVGDGVNVSVSDSVYIHYGVHVSAPPGAPHQRDST